MCVNQSDDIFWCNIPNFYDFWFKSRCGFYASPDIHSNRTLTFKADADLQTPITEAYYTLRNMIRLLNIVLLSSHWRKSQPKVCQRNLASSQQTLVPRHSR